MGLNKFIGTGRLTKDVVYSQPKQQGGRPSARFTIAINRNYKDNEGNTQADFVPCVVWGKLADAVANSLGKGSRCTISGSFQSGSYEGAEGKRVYTTEINVDEVEFLDPKPQNTNGGQQQQQQQQQQGQQSGFPQQGQQYPQYPQQGQQSGFPQQGQQYPQYPQQGQPNGFPQQQGGFPQQQGGFPQQGQPSGFPQQQGQQYPNSPNMMPFPNQ